MKRLTHHTQRDNRCIEILALGALMVGIACGARQAMGLPGNTTALQMAEDGFDPTIIGVVLSRRFHRLYCWMPSRPAGHPADRPYFAVFTAFAILAVVCLVPSMMVEWYTRIPLPPSLDSARHGVRGGGKLAYRRRFQRDQRRGFRGLYGDRGVSVPGIFCSCSAISLGTGFVHADRKFRFLPCPNCARQQRRRPISMPKESVSAICIAAVGVVGVMAAGFTQRAARGLGPVFGAKVGLGIGVF